MLNKYGVFKVVSALMLILLIGELSDARARFSEHALSAQEADNQLNVSADMLAKTTAWQESAFFMLIPEVEVVTVGIGGNFGRGILVARNGKQMWGNPLFMRTASGKIETPNNAKPVAILLTFDNQQHLNTIFKNGSFPATLAQISVYDGQSFSPVSLNGLINVEINPASNANFYGQRVDITDVISGRVTSDSKAFSVLMAVLNR